MLSKYKKWDVVHHKILGYFIIYDSMVSSSVFRLKKWMVLNRTVNDDVLRKVTGKELEEVEAEYGVKAIVEDRQTTPPKRQPLY